MSAGNTSTLEPLRLTKATLPSKYMKRKNSRLVLSCEDCNGPIEALYSRVNGGDPRPIAIPYRYCPRCQVFYKLELKKETARPHV